MKEMIKKTWLQPLIKGILASILGLIAIFFSELSLSGLALAFGIFLLVSGIISLLLSLANSVSGRYWRYRLFESAVYILMGILIMANPQSSAEIFLLIVAVWAIAIGVILLVNIYRKSKTKINRFFQYLSGILSLIFGIVVLWNPFSTGTVIIKVIGVFTLLYGLYQVSLSISSGSRNPEEEKGFFAWI
jgi:uncharacterized membrane protein HdeD (DUF308 family)